MSFAETALLGALAGFTIYLGLPVARLELVSARTRVALAMFSVGVLVFLLVDVLGHGFEIAEEAVAEFEAGEVGFGKAAGLSLLLLGGFGLGSAGLGILERRLRRQSSLPPVAGGSTDVLTVADHHQLSSPSAARSRALHTGVMIAIAIGVHNLAEGLAIGVSAQAGEIGLATVLIIGFALHNSTEGFGIVGPLGGVRPSWRWLALVGLIAGGPTFLGAMVGYQVTSDALELCFYALAGGAILYVIGEIWAGVRRQGHAELGLYLLGVGFLLGVATDLVVAYGGA
jgi:zinc transporter, ZIP family